ncbi:hypothetical protein GKC30_05835 [Pseudodesulfovibrio sp. F-1]|uniref:Hemolysin-type calcium-binding region n=1 Tax=Pseudodesulfovibrio alkaliphilus TaxID=2661613 RepID=A0A7K1KM28_9BACT|nr:FG-GAP-like repeat-containing protein [Pseudodesulfovibrio alkaliphilus]MUM77148.1 hypothetical protein [Pseudodesulfovibrio alkaliphilus]
MTDDNQHHGAARDGKGAPADVSPDPPDSTGPDYFSRLHGPDFWVESTASGTFADTPLPPHLTPTAMAAGDLTGDGRTELVVGHGSGVTILRNDGEWSAENVRLRLDAPRAIVVADVDGDGHADIVLRTGTDLVLLKGHMGTFGTQVLSWPNLGSSTVLAVGSFNITTPTLEIITFNATTGALGIIAHDGASWQAFRAVSQASAVTLYVRDANNDGLSDLCVVDSGGSQTWLISDGSGNFSPQPVLPAISPVPAGPTLNTTQSVGGGAWNIPPESDGKTVSQAADETIRVDRTDPDPLAEPDPGTFHAMGGAGLPTVDASGSPEGVRFDLRETGGGNAVGSDFSDHITGDDQANVLFGGNGHDWIVGGGGNDTLIGGRGNDWLFGGDGNDLLLGGDGDDILFGDKGDDRIYGGQGNDILFGGSGNDTLVGGPGGDILFGGDGDDLLYGGQGQDILTGGRGSDTFHYQSPTEGGDTITDFTPGEDKLSFAFGSGVLRPADALPTETPGQAFIWESSGPTTGRLLYDPETSLAGDEILVAEITLTEPDAALTVDDIIT